MTQLRVLGALLLIVLGASFASLALSGYYAPARPPPRGLPGEPAGDAAPSAPAAPIGWKSRLRFVASNEHSTPAPAKSPAAKPKPTKPPAKKAVGVVKEKRQTAVQWPWSLFSN
jgi:hypothetical protein